MLYAIMIFQFVLLIFLEFIRPKWLSAFMARKSCHGLSGLCMILMGSNALEGRLFVYAVTVVSLMMTWEIPPFKALWFGSPRDVGITVYLLVVSLWFYFELPVAVLAPVFFADPAGAIVGKFFTRNFPDLNPKWCGDKTVLGSSAVFIVTFFTAHENRCIVATIACLGEAIGGKYDNLFIATTVILSYLLTNSR